MSAGLSLTAQSQNFKIERYILVTDTIEDGGIFFAASSDDAEQENDEMDALFDDDLDAGWEGAPDDQNLLTTGLRFRSIFIPRGAVIDSAFIIFYSHEGKSAEDVARITIAGEATDHALTFTEDALISNRPRTAAELLWEVAEEWELWGEYRTPDIKTVIQEIVNRGGWVSGNALAILLLGENQGLSDAENAREFESFENIADPEDGGDGQNHPERVPQLVVYYSVANALFETPVMVTDTIDDNGIVFEASSDDAEQENDEMDSLFDDDLDAGWEGAPEDQNLLTTGIRFRGVNIPKGAVIDSAFIVLTSHEGKSASDVARITIVGEASDNAQTYTEDNVISARPFTTASLLWEVAEEWELWGEYRTPDLKAIVQEVTNRGGWESGNPIAFMLLGENQGLSDAENAREFESFENIADPEDGGDGQNHPERRPRLLVYYSSQSVSTKSVFDAQFKTIKVYPNPAVSGSGISVELEVEGQAQARLFTMQGRLILTQQTGGGRQFQLQTGKLPAGVYILQVIQGKSAYLKQIVIE
jgi:hypothetical protein